jgi:hypothetical protein
LKIAVSPTEFLNFKSVSACFLDLRQKSVTPKPTPNPKTPPKTMNSKEELVLILDSECFRKEKFKNSGKLVLDAQYLPVGSLKMFSLLFFLKKKNKKTTPKTREPQRVRNILF